MWDIGKGQLRAAHEVMVDKKMHLEALRAKIATEFFGKEGWSRSSGAGTEGAEEERLGVAKASAFGPPLIVVEAGR